MGTINRVILIGRLGNDPEERATAGGTRVSSFSLATDNYRGQSGEKTPEWHRVVVFGKTAEQCNQYLRKGRLVCVEGSLKSRPWEKSPGEKIHLTDIVASCVTFLDYREGGSAEEGAGEGVSAEPA